MPARGPRYSKEEFARRAEAIFERDIDPHLVGRNKWDVVAIDIETGAYEVDKDELTASDRLLARVPDCQMWMRRVGFPYLHKFGMGLYKFADRPRFVPDETQPGG